MKKILTLIFTTTALFLSSCAHTDSCCAEKKGDACCAPDKKAKAGECKECEAGTKPGTATAKKDSHQH